MNTCHECGKTDASVRYSYFRRVVGLLVLDRIHTRKGNFCAECRKSLFIRFQLLTLVFGWWGVVAFLVRNPYAIIRNFVALKGSEIPSSDAG